VSIDKPLYVDSHFANTPPNARKISRLDWGAHTRPAKKGEQPNLLGTIVLLSILGSVKVILDLGHSVTVGDRLLPCLAGIRSSLRVEFSVVLEYSSLLHILGVVGGLLLVITVTDSLVLGLGQTGRNIGVVTELSSLDLFTARGGYSEYINKHGTWI